MLNRILLATFTLIYLFSAFPVLAKTVNKFQMQNSIVKTVNFLILAAISAAIVCFFLAGIEHIRSNITAKDKGELERSLIFIILGIILAIALLLSWTVGKTVLSQTTI